ncbi:cell division protein ZapA [Asticcacaulis sp. AND118]|uniref:cell division protein ZapA n=1 Tax=Asticcacaulis sp. AND118 TaxID=2840468 RepID=UPI000D30C679|nr:cell division protein ZapA [Asticcacaulis sp. AND118]UDF02798.1 cell division protein ZapA [Asticcacaulis sp. AND118]
MAEVTVKVNNKPYTVGCADGQEARVQELARIFSDHVEMVVSDVGAIGEVRLFLMASLLLVDEMEELRAQLEEAQSAQARMSAGAFEIERKAAFAISDAAERLEKLVSEV